VTTGKPSPFVPNSFFFFSFFECSLLFSFTSPRQTLGNFPRSSKLLLDIRFSGLPSKNHGPRKQGSPLNLSILFLVPNGTQTYSHSRLVRGMSTSINRLPRGWTWFGVELPNSFPQNLLFGLCFFPLFLLPPQKPPLLFSSTPPTAPITVLL